MILCGIQPFLGKQTRPDSPRVSNPSLRCLFVFFIDIAMITAAMIAITMITIDIIDIDMITIDPK